MSTKEIFLKACNEICDRLKIFKPLQKGQTLKLISKDKDIFFEIYFQSSHRNDSSYIQMLPHINIYSKHLKKWSFEQTKNQYASGIIFCAQLGYLTPYKKWKDWNVAGINYEKAVNEITTDIKKHILPVFDIFQDKKTAISFLLKNGTRFNKWTENNLIALDFMLCFAEKYQAEIFFNDFISQCKFKGKIISLYENLEKENKIDLNYSEFYQASTVKLAFVNGLEIKSVST